MSGKPAFDPNDKVPQDDGQVSGAQAPTALSAPTSSVRKGDASTYPVVRVTRVDMRPNGNTMQIYCYLLNSSPESLVVDKMQLLGMTRRLQDDLRPNEAREYLVYSGPALLSDQQHQALLDYKTTGGDYFEAVYEIMYTYHQESKTYIIGDLRLIPPIRDVYG